MDHSAAGGNGGCPDCRGRSEAFQVQATGGGGAVTSGDLTATVALKSTGGPDGETIIVEDEDDGLPGFGLLAALSALGAALLLRRRS
ncbi:MAG: PGF-CTERM sorting domain-containing protein [Candidatus Poseidoniia archaeon]|nr:PGF-CTERM sorting domain-containing protein [Candidatus Poseidoniia archaeon]